MDSPNESFTISSKEALLEIEQPPPPKHTRNYNPKRIFFTLLILAILISSTMILSSMSKKTKFKSFHDYLFSSTRYYCYLTRYPELCYDSMSSIISDSTLGPGPIFSDSLRVAINELNNVTISITKALNSTTKVSIVEFRLSKCQTWVHDSLSRLDESLSMLGVDSDVESLTYMEMDNMRAWTMAATTYAVKCYSALQALVDIDAEEKMRVDEVKLGVMKARKYMVNSIGLLNGRDSILYDFYNPPIESDDTYYNYYSYNIFDYRFILFFYSMLYLYVGLLYFLFWRSG